MEFFHRDTTWSPFNFYNNLLVPQQPFVFSQGQILGEVDGSLEPFFDAQLLPGRASHLAGPFVNFVYQTSAQPALQTTAPPDLLYHATGQHRRRLRQPTPQEWQRWKPDILQRYRKESAPL